MFCRRKTISRISDPIKKMNGLSLLELLITLVIIGILIMVSMPVYTNHFIHERRLEAEMNLEKAASELENYFISNHTYQNADLSALQLPERIANNHYRLVLTDATDSFFKVAAIPTQNDDPLCGILSLNSLGEKGANGNGTLDKCW